MLSISLTPKVSLFQDPGRVCLGGNDAPGVGSMYHVMVGPETQLEEMPSHRVEIMNVQSHSQQQVPFEVKQMGAQDKYYTDRDYTFKDVPIFLHSLLGIAQANDDKRSPADDDSWLCFEVDEPVRVYLMMDPRNRDSAGRPPTWVSENFADRHEETASSGGSAIFGAADTQMGWFEIYSGEFPAGRICLGGNGCIGNEDAGCSNYVTFVGPQDLEPAFPGSHGASARYFDGDSDYMLIPRVNGGGKNPKRSFETISLDAWVKFMDTQGNHPIMNEDHWDTGDLHYQIYNSEFGFDVNGVGDQTFRWQPQSRVWTYISAQYSTVNHYIKLYVGGQFIETIDCPSCTVPITLDSPRLGAWLDGSNTVSRSMHGMISVFRIWNIETNGLDICPPALTDGLMAQYVFGADTDNVVTDLSGNGNDATVHDASWSSELPPSQQCQRQGFGGLFDGDDDWVSLQEDLGTFPAITLDVWVKFEDITGNHPIVMEDGWELGDIHLQIYGDNFVLGMNSIGDYKFAWQPDVGTWYYIAVAMDTQASPPKLRLTVNNELVDDIGTGEHPYGNGQFTYTVGNWAGGQENAPTTCPCTLPAMQPVRFQSLRLGAWTNTDSTQGSAEVETMDRSMRGSMAVFRLWDKDRGMSRDSCPHSGASHLVVNYLFDSFGGILKDRSGNNHDAVLHDQKFSADYPDMSCIFHKGQILKMIDPVTVGEHGQVSVGCTDCENPADLHGSTTSGGAHQPPTEVNLHQDYANPIVIPGVPTEHGHDSVAIRIQNLRKYGAYASAGINVGSVQYGDHCEGSDCGHNGRMCNTRWCFELFLQEPECLDQWHANEEVAWLAFDEGSYVTNEGLEFQVGSSAAHGGSFEQIRFHNSFNNGVTPVVLAHVQTTHDPHWVKVRMRNSDRAGFEVALEQQGSNAVHGGGGGERHGTEMIGWVAFEPGHGHMGTIQFEAGNTEQTVSEQPETVNFARPFNAAPRFFATIATHAGTDSSQLRQDNDNFESPITTTSATFYIEEETCVDDESEAGNGCIGDSEYVAGNGCHPNPERVSWLAMSPANVQNGGHTVGFTGVSNGGDNLYMMARPQLQSLREIGEQGSARINTGWRTVSLEGHYRNPVVFCGVISTNGGDASVCRIQRVRYNPPITRVGLNEDGSQNNHMESEHETCPSGRWCFDIALQEAPCLDQWHAEEVVPWVVFEEGNFHSDDGAQIQIGKAQAATGGWTNVQYRGTGFATVPVTITTIQTFHGQSCYNDQSGMDNRNDRQQCTSEQWTCPPGANGALNPACQNVGQRDGAGDGYGPGAGFLKPRQLKPSMNSASGINTGYNDGLGNTNPFGQQQSGGGYADESWRMRGDTQRFLLTLENGETHGDVTTMDTNEETVGWAAFQAHHGSLGEVLYEAGSTPLQVTHEPYTINFNGFFRFVPSFFGSIASYHGTDTSELRFSMVEANGPNAGSRPESVRPAITPSSATIFIEEETCNAEQGGYTHPNAEQVDYFAISAGVGSNARRRGGGREGSTPISARPSQVSHAETGQLTPFMETGDISVDHNWVTVALRSYYFHPVVIAGVPSAYSDNAAGDEVAVRIRNVRHGNGCEGWCFDIRVQEPPCKDDIHVSETISWMVMESGSWTGDEGYTIMGGVTEVEGDMRLTGQQFQRVEFYGAGMPVTDCQGRQCNGQSGRAGQLDQENVGLPIVITQCMSYYGSNWVKTRQQQGDNTYFMVALEEVGSLAGFGTQRHTNYEKVGWVAFEQVSGNLGTRDYEADLTPQEVTDAPYTVTFRQPFYEGVKPYVFATMQTYIGTDSAQLRQDNDPTESQVTFRVEEDVCEDDESNHAAEIVGYVAIGSGESGPTYAKSNINLGCEAIYDATQAQLHGAQLESGNPAERDCAANDPVCHNGERLSSTVGYGAIDFVNPTDDTATWDLHQCRAGHVWVIFGYALGGDGATGQDRPMQVDINGEVADAYMSMPRTGSWSTYAEVRVPAMLRAGRNQVTLRAIGFSGPDVDYMAIARIGAIGHGEMSTIGEAGVVHTFDYRLTPGCIAGNCDPEEQWQRIDLGGNYINPVVILGVPSELGGEEAVGRVRGVGYGSRPSTSRHWASDGPCTGHCIDVRLQEPECRDDLHMEEELPWLIMESGTWYTDSGKLIQVGRVDAIGAAGADALHAQPNGFKPVNFHVPFENSDVAVIPQVQTYNDRSFVKARIHPLVNLPRGAPPPPEGGSAPGRSFQTGFMVGLERIGSIDSGSTTSGEFAGHSTEHGQEVIGWMAFQHSSEGDTIGGDVFMADTTDIVVTDSPQSGGIAFCAGFENKPLFFANVATFLGDNSVELRLAQPTTASSAAVYIEEEGCSDEETAHLAEAVSWFAIEHNRGHKIRATAQAPHTAAVPAEGANNGGTTHAPSWDWGPGAADCGEPPEVSSNDPQWQWADNAGQQAGQGQSPEVACAAQVAQVVPSVNEICCADHNACPDGGNNGNFPVSCTGDCAGIWMPIWTDCEAYMQRLFGGSQQQMASINAFSASCQATMNGGDCTESFWQEAQTELRQSCPSQSECPKSCRRVLNTIYETCSDRFAGSPYEALHNVCTGGGPGGGH